MKAIRVEAFGGPDVLKLSQVADPQPGPGEVRVRLHAAGVNPVDTYVRSGNYARLPALPYTPGSDGAGIVEAAGEGVKRVRSGDRVYVAALTTRRSTGTYAESIVCDESAIHPLPDALSFAQGAAVGVPCATAFRALMQKAGAKTGESVLVHGASGSVGLAAVQLAAAAGLTVLATAGSERGRAVAAAQGAHHVFDHGAAGYQDEIQAATGGRGPDIILEMLANVNLAHDLAALAPRGRIVVIGSRGSIEITPRMLMAKDSTVTGMTLFNLTGEELRQVYDAVSEALASGTLRPVVDRELPLGDAPAAHEAVMTPGAAGKVVLVP